MATDTFTDNTTSVHSRMISAVFDTAGAAKKAVDDLVEAGIPRAHITQTNGQTAGEEVETTAPAGEQRSFWEQLKDLFLPDDDRYAYAESLRRGAFLVTARVDEANYKRVLDILDTDGAINMDEREKSWKAEGWERDSAVGESGRSATIPPVGTTAARPVSSDAPASRASSPGSAPISGAASNFATDDAARAAALGIRDDSHGRERLRSYTFDRTPGGAEVGRSSTPFSAVADASRIVEHMDVISADGQKIGEVDHLDGPDRIKLTKAASPDGQHHIVPFTWIDHIDQHVHLKRTTAEVKAAW